MQRDEQIIQKAKSNASNFQQPDGAQLHINIANISKLRELPNAAPYDEPPVHKRGEPDLPMPDSLRSGKSSSESMYSGFSSERQEGLIPPEKLTDEDFDMKGTSRKEYENEYYKRVCSEIIDGFLFLGSDFIAQDKETFDKLGITHVVNCAADYSANYF